MGLVQTQTHVLSLCNGYKYYTHPPCHGEVRVCFLSKYSSIMPTVVASSRPRRRRRTNTVEAPRSSSSDSSPTSTVTSTLTSTSNPDKKDAKDEDPDVRNTLLKRLWKVAAPYWSSDDKVQARLQLAAVFALTLGTTGISVGFNFLGRDFYNALASNFLSFFPFLFRPLLFIQLLLCCYSPTLICY